MSQRWKAIRLAILISTFGAVALVLGKTTLLPNLETGSKKGRAQVSLPKSIPLNGWEIVDVSKLEDQSPDRPSYTAGQEYQYYQGDVVLHIQARYFSKSNGNVQKFINNYLPASGKNATSPPSWTMHTLEETGSFLLGDGSDTLQLSSCINPYGKSTVLVSDYKHNRNFKDIRYRLIPWLLGKPLKDERCLWTHMLITTAQPQATSELPDVERVMLDAWSNWYIWWKHQLPDMGP